MSENNQKGEAMFMQLVLTFQMAAWQQMGKIKSPLTDKIERDLRQAQFSIDMLEMIRSKTTGNLKENENQFLSKILSELQLNFVDEMNKEQKEKEEEKEKEKEKVKEESTEAKQKEKEIKAKEGGEEDKAESPKKSQKSKPEKNTLKSSEKK